MSGDKFFTYRANKDLLNYASAKLEELRNEEDREDAMQEAWCALLASDVDSLDAAKALFNRVISRVGMQAIRHDRRHVSNDGHNYIDLGDGNYQKRAHRSND